MRYTASKDKVELVGAHFSKVINQPLHLTASTLIPPQLQQTDWL